MKASLTVDEAAAYLEVSRRAVYYMLRARRLTWRQPLHGGRRVMVDARLIGEGAKSWKRAWVKSLFR